MCVCVCVCVCVSACVRVRVRVCVVVVVVVKRPALPPCVVDERCRNPLYYYYYTIVTIVWLGRDHIRDWTCVGIG